MAKRFTKPTINWKELEKIVPPEQKTNYMAFKAKSDAYLQRVMANPAEMPKIDWEAYKKLVPDPGIIQQLKSGLEGYKIPYPEDTLTCKIEEQWKELEPKIKKYCDEFDKDIEAADKELKRIRALPKFEEMTLQTYCELYPDSFDPIKKPTFWPHIPEEQEGYNKQKGKQKKAGN